MHAVSKRERSPAEQRRDVRDAAIRWVLSLVELYAEMAETWLAQETYDQLSGLDQRYCAGRSQAQCATATVAFPHEHP